MKKLAYPSLLILAAVSVAFTFWARFAHPQLTETMLFLTYWKQWLCFAALFVLFGLTAAHTDLRK